MARRRPDLAPHRGLRNCSLPKPVGGGTAALAPCEGLLLREPVGIRAERSWPAAVGGLSVCDKVSLVAPCANYRLRDCAERQRSQLRPKRAELHAKQKDGLLVLVPSRIVVRRGRRPLERGTGASWIQLELLRKVAPQQSRT